MSNPAVINLISDAISSHAFRVEDNLGEAVHIHWDSFRFDLSYRELKSLSAELESVIEKMAGLQVGDLSDETLLLLRSYMTEIRREENTTQKPWTKVVSYDNRMKSFVLASSSRDPEKIRWTDGYYFPEALITYDHVVNNNNRKTIIFGNTDVALQVGSSWGRVIFSDKIPLNKILKDSSQARFFGLSRFIKNTKTITRKIARFICGKYIALRTYRYRHG